MKMFSTKGLKVPLIAGIATLALAPGIAAATLVEVFAAAERINEQAKASQTRIDALTEETRELYDDYKQVLKEIEGLRVYNAQLDRQIANQEREMAEIGESVDQVTVIERQITPLMLRMIDGLEQFIALDAPFLVEERELRVDRLRDIMERADVAVSEKFGQVLNAYQIENEYGRTIGSYSGKIELDGAERVVDVLQIGRVALLFQTSDGDETGMWNKSAKRWEFLDDSYQSPVRDGIRMARRQATLNLLPVPILVED